MTADIGMGANMAIESVVVLANVLQRLVAHNPDPNYHPTQAELSDLFTQYQSTRYTRVKQYMRLSGSITRMRSYQSIWKRIWISHIDTLPFMQRIGAKRLVAGLAKAPKLEYVGTRTINENAKGWHFGQEMDTQMSGGGLVLYVLVTSVLGMAISYAAVLNWRRSL
jgi:FAD dependent monooxygenase